MASKLNPNVLYVTEHGESLGSPQADSERTHVVSTVQSALTAAKVKMSVYLKVRLQHEEEQIDLLCVNSGCRLSSYMRGDCGAAVPDLLHTSNFIAQLKLCRIRKAFVCSKIMFLQSQKAEFDLIKDLQDYF